MFRHVVVFRWKAGIDEDQKVAFFTALRSLPDQIEPIRDYRVGPDAGLAETNGDVAIVADFDDVDGYLAYRDHPAHDAFRRDFLTPLVADRMAVQYQH